MTLIDKSSATSAKRSHTMVSARVRAFCKILALDLAHARSAYVCESATCAPPKGGWGRRTRDRPALPWGAIGSHMVDGAVADEACR